MNWDHTTWIYRKLILHPTTNLMDVRAIIKTTDLQAIIMDECPITTKIINKNHLTTKMETTSGVTSINPHHIIGLNAPKIMLMKCNKMVSIKENLHIHIHIHIHKNKNKTKTKPNLKQN